MFEISNYHLYKGAWIDSRAPHNSQQMDTKSIKTLLDKGGVIVRNTYDFDSDRITSFWYVIKDSFGGIDELSSKKRNQVRKSLKTYAFRRVTAEEVLAVGLPIFQEACMSYKVKAEVVTEAGFQKRIAECEKGGRSEYWCAYRKDTNEPVALAINTLYEDCCEYNTLKCKPSAMHNSTYPYYGLIFEMNRYYLDELKLRYVNDGARSITNHSNIQPFLIDTFHFRKAYCKLQIKYKWWFGLLVKMLFPFRKIMPLKVKAVLNMEAMKRGQI